MLLSSKLLRLWGLHSQIVPSAITDSSRRVSCPDHGPWKSQRSPRICWFQDDFHWIFENSMDFTDSKSMLLYGCQYVSWFLCHLMIARGVQWRWHSWLKHLDDLTNVTPGNDMGMLPAARQANHQVGMSRFGPQVFVLQKITWGSDSVKNQDNSFPSKRFVRLGAA